MQYCVKHIILVLKGLGFRIMAKFNVMGLVKYVFNGKRVRAEKDADVEKNVYYLQAIYPTIERRMEAQIIMRQREKQLA